ncbi:uncharacterized protein [Henckelia pumila]|uniref:uncharacterized protein isoform X3 n=1 Tax=Henckelia pumila TaxID=405737 RepID=UPI003C6E302C
MVPSRTFGPWDVVCMKWLLEYQHLKPFERMTISAEITGLSTSYQTSSFVQLPKKACIKHFNMVLQQSRQRITLYSSCGFASQSFPLGCFWIRQICILEEKL